MKSILNHITVASVCLAATFLFPSSLYADDYAPPTYRGKVILVVDKTMAADPQVSSKIERLTQDLAGDGWRVLRHDVERGPITPKNQLKATNDAWAQVNAPRVREVRAIIKADYNAAPTDVKAVFLIGHIPIPYSGTLGGLNGGHYPHGSAPADTFYGEMTASYGPGGWSDLATALTSTDAPWLSECDNYPGDGKFDQDLLPAPMKLAVGRLDLSDVQGEMSIFGVNEATLISRYLDKDHDFRCCVFAVHRRAIANGWTDPMTTVFGEDNVLLIGDFQWFTNVSGSGQDYLLGGVFGTGSGGGQNQLGPNIDFVTMDSRVVFVNLYGSWFANWDEAPVLKTPLANPYDPANGRYGYGLDCIWSTMGLDLPTLTERSLGATIGEAIFVGNTFGGTELPVNFGLMGDPTLRMHSVLPISSLTATKTDTTVTLTWTASSDATEGYNIYCAPTRNGPFVPVNTAGPVTSTTYAAARPSTGAPDNFYLIRAVKLETTLVGSYHNMSEGVVASLPGYLTSYLNIISSPANQLVGFNAGDGVVNSAAFNVDAVGVDAAGSQQITYQWFKDGLALSSEDCHFSGVNSPGLLIKGVQSSDIGNYYVVVGNSSGSLTSAPASLSFLTAADNSYTIVRNTPTDLDVLANDSVTTGAGTPSNSGLTIVSVSALSNPQAGTITINPDNRTIHFVPNHTWLGPVTFVYVMTDGTGTASATVTMAVIKTPNNFPPTVSTIGDQQMAQDTTINVSFMASDDFTTPDDLIYVATCSNSVLIPNGNFSVTGNGTARVLHIKAGTHQYGSGVVTLSVTDDDGATTTIPSFQVTINQANAPTLLQPGFSDANTFNVTIGSGLANSVVEVEESDDLVTWKSLGTVTLSGNFYNFADTTAGSSTHRFYHASGPDGCSVNTIGFIQVTVPANGYAVVANQLNNPAGNTVPVLFAGAAVGTTFGKWNSTTQVNYSVATYVRAKGSQPAHWDNPTATVNPGEGVFVNNPTATPWTVTFVGDVPQGQQVNNDLPTTAGNISLISSILPRVASLDELGFPAVEGDQIKQWDVGSQQLVTTATYTGGNWSPAAPTVAIGEGFYIQCGSGGASRQPWIENFSGCLPEVSLTSPAEGSVLVGPAVVVLSANATADAGVTKVEFFQGNTSLGVGTQSGSSYILNWNNPAAGTYSVTAHATDNNGVTVISAPVNITVYAQPGLSSETYSGGTFQFTINGSPGVSVEVKASDDLATWTSLGTVPLTSGSYNYVDTAAGTHRFYRVQENGVCSVNTIGFIQVTVPANGYAVVANQLNNPAGNTVPVLFAGAAVGTTFGKWNSTTQVNYSVATYVRAKGSQPAHWDNPTATVNPGEGVFVNNPTATPWTVTFVGDVPQGQQVNNDLPTTAGNVSLISSILPRAGDLSTLGFPAVEGDQIKQWDVGSQQLVTTATYMGGNWSPAAPTVAIGEGFYIQCGSGGASRQPWTENFSGCP